MIVSVKNKLSYLCGLLLLSIFLILKMQRGFSGGEEQGGFWNFIQFFFVLFGLYILFKNKVPYTESKFLITYITFMVYIWFLSFFDFIYMPKLDVNTFFRFLVIPYGIMVVLVFYYLGINYDIKKYPYILYSVYLIITYILFTSLRTSVINSDSKGAIADVYYIVGLLPIIFIYTPPTLRMLPFFLACVAVMMTGKRTGFLMLAVVMVTYFMFGEVTSLRSIIKRFLLFFIVLLSVAFIVSHLVDTFDLKMFDRLERLDEDGGSGRAQRWDIIFTSLSLEQSMTNLIVGHGYHSVTKLAGGNAHNDFLQIAYDYGVIALIMYVIVFYCYIKEMFQMFMLKFPYSKEFMVSFIVSIFLAMFSFYVIDCTHITCCSVCIGLIMAEWYKYKRNISNVE